MSRRPLSTSLSPAGNAKSRSPDKSLTTYQGREVEKFDPAEYGLPPIDLWHVADEAENTRKVGKHVGPACSALCGHPALLTADAMKAAKQSISCVDGVTAHEHSRSTSTSRNGSPEHHTYVLQAPALSYTTSSLKALDLSKLHLSAFNYAQSAVRYPRGHYQKHSDFVNRLPGRLSTMQADQDLFTLPKPQTAASDVLLLFRDKLKAVVGMTPAFQRGDGQFEHRDWRRRWAMHSRNIAHLLNVIDLHGQHDEAYELAYDFDRLEKQQRLVQMRAISRRIEAQLGHLIDVSSMIMEEGEYELPWPTTATHSER